jgi:hypothetical protein
MSGVVHEHTDERGEPLSFASARLERLAVMKAALRRGLMVWNIRAESCGRPTFGHKRLEEYRHKIATGV